MGLIFRCDGCRQIAFFGLTVAGSRYCDDRCWRRSQQIVVRDFCEACQEESVIPEDRKQWAISGLGLLGEREIWGDARPCRFCGSTVQTEWLCYYRLPLMAAASYRILTTDHGESLRRRMNQRHTPHLLQIYGIYAAIAAIFLWFFIQMISFDLRQQKWRVEGSRLKSAETAKLITQLEEGIHWEKFRDSALKSLAAGNASQAVADFRIYERNCPDAPPVAFEHALALWRAGDMDSARETLTRATRLLPGEEKPAEVHFTVHDCRILAALIRLDEMNPRFSTKHDFPGFQDHCQTVGRLLETAVIPGPGDALRRWLKPNELAVYHCVAALGSGQDEKAQPYWEKAANGIHRVERWKWFLTCGDRHGARPGPEDIQQAFDKEGRRVRQERWKKMYPH